MRSIKIKFTDFYSGFVLENFVPYRLLKQRYNLELSDTPDYVIYSAFGNEHLRYGNCIKIFWTGENQSPDFNFCDYAIGFDYMTYGDRYLRYPLYRQYEQDMIKAAEKHFVTAEDVRQKSEFCSFVYSNHNASAERGVFYDLLSRYKQINSGGKYRNNIGAPVQDLYAFQLKHKFVIAFENTSMPGYTTEKILRAFAAQTVPIYWGDPRVNEEFNSKSFINCHDYASLEEVVERVRLLDNDTEAYMAMLKEPAFANTCDRDTILEHKQLKAFLYHIFDQETKDAPRYSRDYWNHKITDQRTREAQAFRRSFYGIGQRLYNQLLFPLARKSTWGWKMTSRLMKIMKKY